MIPVSNRFPEHSVEHVHRTLSILRLAFSMGCLFFLGISIYLVKVEGISVEHTIPLRGILTVLLLTVVIISFIRRKYTSKQLIKIVELEATKEKLRQFRSLMITNLALIEGTVLITTIAYFLTGYNLFLIVVAVLIIDFFLLKTDPASIRQKLALPDTDFADQG